MPPSHSRAIARADDVDQADDPAALAPDLLDREQGVDGLAGLADRDVERVRLDDRVAVAELAGRLGVGRDPGQLLDQRGAHLADVVRRAAAEDLDPPDRARSRGRPCSRPPRCAVPNRSSSRPRSTRSAAVRLLEHLLVHERVVVARVVRRRVDVDRRSRVRAAWRQVLAVRREAVGRDRGQLAVVEVDDRASCSGPARPGRRRRTSRWSPTPMISGLPLRATTIRSGKSACRTASP